MNPPSRLKAILLGFLVSFIWSTSWVLIKIGLEDIPALTFAGLRYFLGFLCLLPFLLRQKVRQQVKQFNRADWGWIVLMGVVGYAIAQGTQFISMQYLPATTLSLLLNIAPLFVTFIAIFLVKEMPTWLQWIGLAVNLAGVFIFFYPQGFRGNSVIGFTFAIVCLFANVFFSLIGRKLNRNGRLDPLAVTMMSMGIGAVLMLVTGIAWQGLPRLSPLNLLIIGVLAVMNTALAFTIWTYTQQTLSAMESSIMMGTMMVFVAALSWIFLHERQSTWGVLGLALSFSGAILVNLRIKSHKNSQKT